MIVDSDGEVKNTRREYLVLSLYVSTQTVKLSGSSRQHFESRISVNRKSYVLI